MVVDGVINKCGHGVVSDRLCSVLGSFERNGQCEEKRERGGESKVNREINRESAIAVTSVTAFRFGHLFGMPIYDGRLWIQARLLYHSRLLPYKQHTDTHSSCNYNVNIYIYIFQLYKHRLTSWRFFPTSPLILMTPIAYATALRRTTDCSHV